MARPKSKSLITTLNRHKVAVAAACSDDDRFHAFAQDLLSPEKIEIEALVAKHRIGIRKFVEMWRDHQHAVALLTFTNKLKSIYSDMLEDAKSTRKKCPEDGCVRGIVSQGEDENGVIQGEVCVRCEGTGSIRVPGDVMTRKLLLDVMGLVNRKQPQVVLQQNFSNPGSVESTTSQIGRILDAKVEE